MDQQSSNSRWLNNPLRRVGRDQLLRTMRAAVGESHPAYQDYRERLATSPVDSKASRQIPGIGS